MTLSAIRPQLREIPIGLIDEPALASRTQMDDAKMDDLVASIRSIGFVSVLVVVQVGGRYEVVAGHRRRIAAGRAGIVAVPCLVYPSKDDAVEAIQHAENKHREDLNPADESIWFAQLLEKHPEGGTDGVAARVGETRAYVEGRLALLSGCEMTFNALAAGRIGIGVAQELNRCSNPQYRAMLLDQAIRNGATKSIVSGWIAEWKQTIEPAMRDVDLSAAPPSNGTSTPYEFFTCGACDLKTNPANMRPLQFHDYCIESQLKPALEFFHRRSDYVRVPRTIDEARELAAQLVERFPELVPE